MLEENTYVGFIKTIQREPIDDFSAIIKPLMIWNSELSLWVDINHQNNDCLFPIKGDVWWSNISDNISEGQLWKFKIVKNKDYKPSLSTQKAGSIQNRKFIVLKDSAYELFEIKSTNFNNLSEIKSSLIKEGLPSIPFCNSQVLISFDENKLIGPLEFIIDENKNRLRLIRDNLSFDAIPIYSILSDIKIKPAALNGRIFIDQKTNFGEIIDYYNWYINSENIKNYQIYDKLTDDQDTINKIIEEVYSKVHEQIEIKVNQLRQEKAQLEHQIIQIRQDAIKIRENELAKAQDYIAEIRRKSQEQIEKEIAIMCHQKAEMEHKIDNINQIFIEKEAEIESKKTEKINLENEIIVIKNESIRLEKNVEKQRARMSQILDEFDQRLTEHFNRLISNPTNIMAEILG